MNDYSKKRIGVYFDDETIRLCDAGIALTNTKNRSEFLKDAVEFYTTVMMKNHTAEVLTPALESVIRSSIQITEDRISRNIFKQAVSIATMMYVMADVYDMNAERLKDLQALAFHNISRVNGKFKFEDVLKYND